MRVYSEKKVGGRVPPCRGWSEGGVAVGCSCSAPLCTPSAPCSTSCTGRIVQGIWRLCALLGESFLKVGLVEVRWVQAPSITQQVIKHLPQLSRSSGESSINPVGQHLAWNQVLLTYQVSSWIRSAVGINPHPPPPRKKNSRGKQEGSNPFLGCTKFVDLLV